MITEDYCSYEVAKLLKEKGFDVDETHMFYSSYDPDRIFPIIEIGLVRDEDVYFAPTHQMAMKWLREKHNINIDIVSIWNQKRWEYQVFVVTPENAKQCYVNDKIYLGYEKAVEAALKYVLENLI